jgi:nucleotide-binding universal stress UspA family protein
LRRRGHHAVGDPAEEFGRIIQQKDIDLLIIGRNAVPEKAPGWGRSGLKLLRTAGVSTLVIPVGEPVGFERVVCGLDFSHTSTDALAVAARISRNLEVICQYSQRSLRSRDPSAAQFAEQLGENAREHFDSNVLPGLPQDTQPVLHVVEGDDHADVLIDRAGSDTIVVGSRGLSQFAARLLGSTAERVAGYSKGPVLIVRKKGESLGLLSGLFHR